MIDFIFKKMKNFFKSLVFSYFFLAAIISNEINSFEIKNKNIKTNIESINLISNAIEEKKIKTVTSNGFGTTLESAAQNAAENALTQVVGSFIDAETQIKKQKEIRDGVISKTKIIKKDIRDYSQGSIKYFEILNVQEKDSIYILTARVDVRIDDFKAYIKKLAFDNLIIDQDLFTSIKVEESNNTQRAELIASVTYPIFKGEVIDIERGNQQLLEDFSSFGCKYDPAIGLGGSLTCRDEGMVDSVSVMNFKRRGTIIFPYVLKLNQEFIINAKKKLDNISDFKRTLPAYYDIGSRTSPERKRFLKGYQYKDYVVEIVNNDLKTSDFYLFNQLLVDDPNFITNPKSNDYYSMRFSFKDLNNQELCVISSNIYTSAYDGIFETLKCLNSKIKITFVQVVGYPYGSNARGHNFTASSYKTGNHTSIKAGIINDKTKMLLIIEPSEEFLKGVKNISLEIVPN